MINELAIFKLSVGKHNSPQDGMCHQEAVAWMAGEPHSDRPKCVAPCLGVFARRGQDDTPDDLRHLWNPTILKCIDTVSKDHENERKEFLLRAVFRRLIPITLDGWRDKEAKKWRELPAKGPIKNFIKSALDLALNLNLPLDLDLALDLALALDLDLVIAIDRAIHRARDRTFAAYYREMVAIFDEAIELGPHNRDEFYAVPEHQARIEKFKSEVLLKHNERVTP